MLSNQFTLSFDEIIVTMLTLMVLVVDKLFVDDLVINPKSSASLWSNGLFYIGLQVRFEILVEEYFRTITQRSFNLYKLIAMLLYVKAHTVALLLTKQIEFITKLTKFSLLIVLSLKKLCSHFDPVVST